MISDGVAHELVVIAQYLIDEDPDATFSDLLKAYFMHITGLDYDNVLDNPPDDEDIVRLHIGGYPTGDIANLLGDHEDYVRWVLLTLGFSPSPRNEEARRAERAHYRRLVDNGIL
jgi:hypothetical protein